MNKIVFLAAIAILPLHGCSTNPANTVAATTPVAGNTLYCWKTRLAGSSGQMHCNWSANRDEACESQAFQVVDASRYSEPKGAGMCRNGQWLVAVQAK